MGKAFIAHTSADNRVQTVSEHLINVAKLAQKFAAVFDAGSIGYLCGLAHDLGKYSSAFQRRILENGPIVDHSSAGAQEIAKLSKYTEQLNDLIVSSYCIAGHHAGLMDYGSKFTAGTLAERLNKPLTEELNYAAYADEIDLVSAVKNLKRPRLKRLDASMDFSWSFLARMVFSCLVDADYLDTSSFIRQEDDPHLFATINELLDRLNRWLEQNHWLTAKSGINQKRSEILSQCIETGKNAPRGLYSLTVPTGGGKTVSSLAFALNHAVAQKMDRIIYVVPYISIIDQTVQTYYKLLGEENVLAHYSEIQYDDSNEIMSVKRLATENWDMPLIVTTSVQFFESLFSNKTSACRKLHNIANSVIIFDEAQTLPLFELRPCISAIAELINNYRTTCVLCTATQPSLYPLLKEYDPNMPAPTEICPNINFSDFKRVTYHKLSTLSDNELAIRLNAEQQVLCIVPTKKQALNVYRLLDGEDGNFHLSTFMTPFDRGRTIEEIKRRLSGGKPCRVVSTSLIEAGVDLDFKTVYRAYAGLDSEIQAAGRCNREGKYPFNECSVFLFEPEKGKYQLPDYLLRPKEEAEDVTRGTLEIDSKDVIDRYFTKLYRDTGEGLDRNHILNYFIKMPSGNMKFDFSSAANDFSIIDNNTWTILIPRDKESRKLCQTLLEGDPIVSRQIMRQCGKYTVNIYENQFQKISPFVSVIGEPQERLAILIDESKYSTQTGLEIPSVDGGWGLFA